MTDERINKALDCDIIKNHCKTLVEDLPKRTSDKRYDSIMKELFTVLDKLYNEADKHFKEI